MAEQRVTEADIRAVLAGTYTPEDIEIWLHTSNRNLDGQMPHHLLLCCRAASDRVLAEAERVAGAM